jgi:hypothetical protein
VYTLRLTRVLLDQVEPVDADDELEVGPGRTPRPPGSNADDPPTTRLGDWYVTPLDVGTRHLILCTSERSLLSVVLPADDLPELPERLVTAVVGVLHRLGVPKDAVVAEVDAMTSGGVGVARNRSTLGAMRGLAARTVAFLDGTRGDVDVAALYADLATYRSRALGGHSAGERAIELLAARPARPARSPRVAAARRVRR